jgi:hypothetical protein
MVAEQPERDAVGQLAMTVNELSIGVEVALRGTPDKLAVIDIRRSRA